MMKMIKTGEKRTSDAKQLWEMSKEEFKMVLDEYLLHGGYKLTEEQMIDIEETLCGAGIRGWEIAPSLNPDYEDIRKRVIEYALGDNETWR